MSVAMLEISSEIGFSKSAVHRMLSGAGRIYPEVRDKVMEYVKKHNYQLSLQARSLVEVKTFILVVVVPDLSSQAYAKAIAGVEKVAHEGFILLSD